MAKIIITTKKLLNLITEEDPGVSAELQLIIAAEKHESQWLEFKSGIPRDKLNYPQMIREYVSAFANSDGGTLAIGIDDKTKNPTGCSCSGGQGLVDWGTNCLLALVGLFTHPPIACQVELNGNPVLLIAVRRNFRLVPISVESELCHYMRFGSSTLLVPDFLLSDLYHGRRQYPTLEVEILTSHWIMRGDPSSVQITFLVKNDGLVVARNVYCGLLSNHQQRDSKNRTSKTLASLVENQTEHHGIIVYKDRSLECLPPFELTRLDYEIPIQVNTRYDWKMAFYMMPADSFPVWWQIEATLSPPIRGDTGGNIEMKIRPHFSGKPILSFTQIGYVGAVPRVQVIGSPPPTKP